MSKHKHHASTEPQDYPRRILLAATGLSPQVVTETLYALAVAGRPAFLPTEVHLITTKEGKRNAELSLLAGHAWLSRLCDEYDLPPIAFSPDNIYVIGGSDPLTDIRTARDNDIAAGVREVAVQVHRHDWERYSKRQERKIKLADWSAKSSLPENGVRFCRY